MTKESFQFCCRGSALSALVGVALCLQAPHGSAQGLTEAKTTETRLEQAQDKPLLIEKRAQVTYDAYILGPGDGLQIELSICPS